MSESGRSDAVGVVRAAIIPQPVLLWTPIVTGAANAQSFLDAVDEFTSVFEEHRLMEPSEFLNASYTVLEAKVACLRLDKVDCANDPLALDNAPDVNVGN